MYSPQLLDPLFGAFSEVKLADYFHVSKMIRGPNTVEY